MYDIKNEYDDLLNSEFTPQATELQMLSSLEGSEIVLESLEVTPASYIPGDQFLYSYGISETRGFTDAVDATAERFYHHQMHGGNNPLMHKQAVADVISQGLTYHADRSPILIPSGWNDDRRGTFTLRCSIHYPNNKITLLVRGFTSHKDVVSNGAHGYSLPLDTVFYVNDVCELQIVNGTERFVNVTKELRTPNSYNDGFSDTNNNDRYATITPTDVLRHTSTAAFMEHEFEGDVTENVSSVLVAPTASNVNNDSPISWATEVVGDYTHAVNEVIMENGRGVTQQSVEQHILNNSLMHDDVSGFDSNAIIYEFLNYISQGGDVRYFDLEFDMRSLVSLDPTLDDRTDVLKVGDSNGLIVDEHGQYVNPNNLSGFESTSGGTSETQVGNMVAKTLASVLQRASILGLQEAIITNHTHDGRLEVVLHNCVVATRQQTVVDMTIASAVRTLKLELSSILDTYGDVDIRGITYEPPNVISMIISMNGGHRVPYAAPLWADAMTSPVIQNMEAREQVGGHEVNTSIYQQTMSALGTTLTALSPVRS